MDPQVRRRLGLTQVEVTQLGFGGAGLGDLFEVIPEAQAAATLEAAWDAGIRYYDTAPWYGLTQSEHRFGRALYRQPRRDFVLSTKVGRTMHAGAIDSSRGSWPCQGAGDITRHPVCWVERSGSLNNRAIRPIL